MDERVMELLEDLDVGAFTSPESIESDGATEIIYCDEDYTFPTGDAVLSLALDDVPASLAQLVTDAAKGDLWTADCKAYLAELLYDAKITCYPIPHDAAYAVDVPVAP
jgi:hypothetical protein